MRHAVRFASAIFCFSFVAMSVAAAQIKYNEGPVERVTLIDILPGHFDAFMDDLKTNIVPIWQAEKEAGLIQDYQMFLNQTANGPDDWSFGFAITYKNMAALDGLADTRPVVKARNQDGDGRLLGKALQGNRSKLAQPCARLRSIQ